MNTQMRAYHSDPKLKKALLREVRKHEKADQIIAGTYGNENGKNGRWVGCAVGCSIHSLARIQNRELDTSNHSFFESEAGVPLTLAYLQDYLFEGLPAKNRKYFPARFWAAINVGSALSRVQWQFLHWLLIEELVGKDHSLVAAAITQCADVLLPLTRGEPVSAESAARAARAARAAAVSAAESAAVRFAAESAASAVGRAKSARFAAYTRMADKLICLLEAA